MQIYVLHHCYIFHCWTITIDALTYTQHFNVVVKVGII